MLLSLRRVSLALAPALLLLSLLFVVTATAAVTNPAQALAAPGDSPHNDLTRQRDPVIVRGSSLPSFFSAPLDELFLYAYDGSAWRQIPFQWNEVNSAGEYVSFEDGLLDNNDELAFMALDADQQAPLAVWIENNASTLFPRNELQVVDPLHLEEQAWAYLYRSPDLTADFAPYLQIDNNTVTTPFFSSRINFTETLGLTSLSLNQSPVDILDQTHVSVKGRLGPIVPIQICEAGIVALLGDSFAIELPSMDLPVRYVTGTINAEGIAVYPASLRLGLGINLDAFPDIPGVTLDEIRLSILDLIDPAGSGYAPTRYINSNTPPAGVAVDGSPDTVSTDLPQWIQYNGSYGTIVELYDIQATGTSVNNYYLDNAAAAPGDCHGADGAFGESGLRIAPVEGQIALTAQIFATEPLGEAAGDTYQAYAANPLQSVNEAQATCYFADVEPNADHGNPLLCDGDVDVADVQRVAACWNEAAGSAGCPASLDVDFSSFIDLTDLTILAEQWGWES